MKDSRQFFKPRPGPAKSNWVIKTKVGASNRQSKQKGVSLPKMSWDNDKLDGRDVLDEVVTEAKL